MDIFYMPMEALLKGSVKKVVTQTAYSPFNSYLNKNVNMGSV